MAGPKLYISEMLASLEAKLDTVMTSLASVVSNLQIVNASVTQNLDTLSVQAGTSHSYTFGPSGIFSVTGNGVDGGVKQSVFKVKMLCNGSVTIDAFMSQNPATSFGGLWMKKNEGAWVKIITTVTAPSGQVFSTDIDVSFGDVIEFAVGGYQNGVGTTVAGPMTITYDIKNLAENGAFADV